MGLEQFFKDFQDHLAPRLDTCEQAVYLYLFRHTRFIGLEEAVIGFKSARRRVGPRRARPVLRREVLVKMLESLRLLLSACSLVLLVMSIYFWRWPETYYASQPPARYLRWFAAWLALAAVLYLLLWLTVNLAQESNSRGYVSQSIFFVSLTALLLTAAGNLYRNLSRRALSDEGEPTRPDNARTAAGAWVTITSLLLAGYIHFLWLSVGHGPFMAFPLALTIFGAAVGVWFMMPHSKARG